MQTSANLSHPPAGPAARIMRVVASIIAVTFAGAIHVVTFPPLIIIGCFALVAFLPYAAAILMVAVTAMLFILTAYDAGLKA